MTAKATEPKEQPTSTEKPECFVIMPISDREGYEPGHFKRVYDWIIKPACDAAGYKPVRGDDVSSSHLIVADILKRIVEAPMAICDVSSLNANVMFELGIRQAFGKPVALMKDDLTERVFDISGLRATDYSSLLRADQVDEAVFKLINMLRATAGEGTGLTSLMSLVDIGTARLSSTSQLTNDTKILLKEISQLSTKFEMLAPEQNISTHDAINHIQAMNEEWDMLIEETSSLSDDELIAYAYVNSSSEDEANKLIEALRAQRARKGGFI